MTDFKFETQREVINTTNYKCWILARFENTKNQRFYVVESLEDEDIGTDKEHEPWILREDEIECYI